MELNKRFDLNNHLFSLVVDQIYNFVKKLSGAEYEKTKLDIVCYYSYMAHHKKKKKKKLHYVKRTVLCKCVDLFYKQ